jgi:hypothetical protein
LLPAASVTLKYHPLVTSQATFESTVLPAEHARPRWVMWGGISLYVVLSSAYVVWGRLNIDEGWYLYASQLVWRGWLPYRDFAFTQMPALPYLYGLPLLVLGPSLYLGRLITMAAGLAQLTAAIALARRYAGPWAGALTAILLGTFTNVVYFDTIVKTYAFVALLFTLTFLAIPAGGGNLRRWCLALACATLAAQLRFSALAFLAPIVLYALLTVRGGLKARGLLVAWGLALWLPALFVLTRDPDATRWNLVTYHLSQWPVTGIAERASAILLYRLPLIALAYAPHLALAVLILGVALAGRQRLHWLGTPGLMALSLGLFVVSHLTNGVLYPEYFVPAAAAAMPLLAMALVQVWNQARHRVTRVVLAGGTLLTLWVTLHPNYPAGLDLATTPYPVEAMRSLAQTVARSSQPADRVLALDATIVAVEARRALLPGYELSYFGLQALDELQAQALHVVTPERLLADLERQAAKIAILSEHDWSMLDALGAKAQVSAALAENYAPIATQASFGQWDGDVTVYACRACP